MTAAHESPVPSGDLDLSPDRDPDQHEADDPDSLLTPDEVVRLQRQIEAGLLARAARLDGPRPVGATDAELLVLEELGEQARHRFIRANLRLVGMVARQFAMRTRLPHADLFQEGCLGLITAVERFDYARGHRFSTYALFWIRAYIGSATARQFGAINLPTSRAEKLRSAHGVEARLAQQLGRVPSVSEVALELGRSAEWTAGLLAHQRPQSLELVEGALLDQLQASADVESFVADDPSVRDLLRRLDPLSRQVLELRLGFVEAEPCSVTETARRLSISVTKVRRVQERAIEQLRGICPQNAGNRL